MLARQTLVGGNYELLRCSSGRAGGGTPEDGKGCDFEPHPDYYIALLWKRLMGRAVLGTGPYPRTAKTPGHFEIHAHCTAGTINGSVTIGYVCVLEDLETTADISCESFAAI